MPIARRKKFGAVKSSVGVSVRLTTRTKKMAMPAPRPGVLSRDTVLRQQSKRTVSELFATVLKRWSWRQAGLWKRQRFEITNCLFKLEPGKKQRPKKQRASVVPDTVMVCPAV